MKLKIKMIKWIEKILGIRHIRLCQEIFEYNDGQSVRYTLDQDNMKWYNVKRIEPINCRGATRNRYIIPIDASITND